MESGYPCMVGAVLSVTVHAKRVMRASTSPQIVSLPLVTNQRNIYREGKGGEGPQASESSSHSSRALLPVLLERARFFGRAACDLVTRQAAEVWESVSPTRGATPTCGNKKKEGKKVSAGGAGGFVLGTRYGANFCFHHMCLYPKCSDFSREIKNTQSDLLLLLGPLCMGTRQVKQFCHCLVKVAVSSRNLRHCIQCRIAGRIHILHVTPKSLRDCW